MMEKDSMFRIMNQKYSLYVVDKCLLTNEMMVYRLNKKWT